MRTTLQRIVITAAALIATPALAQAPPIIPFQGFLTDVAGAPRDGESVVDIELFDSAVDGASLYAESLVVDVVGGYFTAELGTGDALDLALFRDNSEVWVQVTVDDDVLSPRIQFGSVPFAAWADWAGDAATLNGRTADELAATDWADVTGIPESLLDGDDVGATDWSELTGIPPSLIDGVDVSDLDLSGYQVRVTEACPVGSSIRAIGADGLVTCQVDTDTDTDTTYVAGAGLTLVDTTFAVDMAAIQARVTGECPVGQLIRAIAADGTVTCEADNINALPTEGVGIELIGPQINLAEDGVTAREIAPRTVTEEEITLPGFGYVGGPDERIVFARFMRTDFVSFTSFRIAITANGLEGPGSSTPGGAGTATIDLGGSCATNYGPDQVVSLLASPFGGYPTMYTSDLFTISVGATCFVAVRVVPTNPEVPVVIRSVELLPDYSVVTIP